MLAPRAPRCIGRISRSHTLTGQALRLGLNNSSEYIQSLLLKERGDDQRHLLDGAASTIGLSSWSPRLPAGRGQVEGVRRTLHREEVLFGRDVRPQRGRRPRSSLLAQDAGCGGPTGGGAGSVGAAGGNKAGGAGDGARRRRRERRVCTDSRSGMKYYSDGVTTTSARQEGVLVSSPGVGSNTSSPVTSRRRAAS